jgi:phosphoribosylformylglycinamidine synthase I
MMMITTTTQLRIGIARFLGSNCDEDCAEAVRQVMHATPVFLWQDDANTTPETLLTQVDAIIIPGGFSYGDYLRCGAMASQTPLMANIKAFAAAGKPVLGICNGFQILTESGLLPGALIANKQQQFLCHQHTQLRVEQTIQPFTHLYTAQQTVTFPIAHGEGCYTADEHTLAQLEANNQVVFRYVIEVNGSCNNIAGICNTTGNVLGLMPHPERNWWKNLAIGRSGDGQLLFEALAQACQSARLVATA